MFEDFRSPLSKHWSRTTIGGAKLERVESGLRLGIPSARQGIYSDAQIDDYGKLARSQFPWRPPLRMEIAARASLPAASPDIRQANQGQILRGTAGFGFWNYPFSVRGDILMLPEAVWFFYASPPSNMALVPGISGWGWKAQVVHSMRPGALLAALPLAASAGLARLTGQIGPAARQMQRLTGASEQQVQHDLTGWQNYTLEWRAQDVRFQVAGQEILRAPHPPTRPLGFVAWLDNQFAIATPQGQLRFGTIESGPQWLEIANLRITPLQPGA